MNKSAQMSPPSPDQGGKQESVEQKKTQETRQGAASPYAGRPLDGSQYVDVVEEQEYADRRPSQEEQQPRFSFRANEPQHGVPDASQRRP